MKKRRRFLWLKIKKINEVLNDKISILECLNKQRVFHKKEVICDVVANEINVICDVKLTNFSEQDYEVNTYDGVDKLYKKLGSDLALRC